MYNLKAHLLERLRNLASLPELPDLTRTDISSVCILDDVIFIHKVMRINYDTYDMRREQDSINPSNHADVMMLAPEGSEHPYLYARVLGVFHVNAYIATPNTTRVEPRLLHVVWVRWFEVNTRAPGIAQKRLTRLSWVPHDEGAFDFVSPDDILRACYIVPRFAGGHSNTALPGTSMVRRQRDGGFADDWTEHYVVQWVLLAFFTRLSSLTSTHEASLTAICSCVSSAVG